MPIQYYDLITSLPQLPHFADADHSPITRLRLEQRLRRLHPEHADQLSRAQPLVRWRPERLMAQADATIAKAYAALLDTASEASLREYVAFRMDQQTLLAALRRKRDGLGLPEASVAWGVGPRVLSIRRHWDAADFGLAHVYPWLPPAREHLAAGDALGLERLLMDVAWQWLSRCGERGMFDFPAVFAYVFKWEMLQAWLACDADQARTRFTTLIDQVTHVERN